MFWLNLIIDKTQSVCANAAQMLMNGIPSLIKPPLRTHSAHGLTGVGASRPVPRCLEGRGFSLAWLAVGSLLLAHAVWAAESPVPAGAVLWEKPAWLADLGLGVKESHDDNVMLLVEKAQGMPRQSSWITTVSPRIGADLAPLLGKDQAIRHLTVIYAPEFAIYHNLWTESFDAHRFTNAIAGQVENFSFSVNNGLTFVDGSSDGPTFKLPGTNTKEDYSVLAVSAVRERRLQVQDGLGVQMQYDAGQFFVRPTASFAYWDLMTVWHNNGTTAATGPVVPGYIDYVDRSDVNGGLDAGYKIEPDLALTLGYRYGHQYQQSFPKDINALAVNGLQAQASSDYQRVLVGVEGRPWSWLTLNVRGGPDFRAYGPAAPVDDRRPTVSYVDGSATAAIAANQSLSFTCKHWQWVSSIGRLPYVENVYSLTYHWNPTARLGCDVSGRFANQDYNCASPTLSKNFSLRNDAMYTFAIGASYAVTPNLSASLSYAYDLGRNLQDSVATDAYRQFDHQVVALGAKWKF